MIKYTLLAFFIFGSNQAFSKCQLPSPDEATDTLATISGTISKINIEQKLMSLDTEKGHDYEIDLSKISEKLLFTQFGGKLSIENLREGDRIELWTKDCKITKGGKIAPAVIRVSR